MQYPHTEKTLQPEPTIDPVKVDAKNFPYISRGENATTLGAPDRVGHGVLVWPPPRRIEDHCQPRRSNGVIHDFRSHRKRGVVAADWTKQRDFGDRIRPVLPLHNFPSPSHSSNRVKRCQTIRWIYTRGKRFSQQRFLCHDVAVQRLQVLHGLLVVGRLEFDSDPFPSVLYCAVNLGTDTHERRQHHLAWVGP